MAISMDGRFTDEQAKSLQDAEFVTRDRRSLTLRIAITYALSFITIYICAILFLSFGHQALFFIILSAIIGTLGAITLVSLSQNHDLVMVTEFQNAILASATQVNARFCLVTKRDGAIVYTDPSFQQFFPEFMQNGIMNVRALQLYSESAGKMSETIIEYLEKNTSGTLKTELKDSQKNRVPIMIHVDILPKPKGYFLIRGRNYIDNRTSSSDKDAITSSPSAST